MAILQLDYRSKCTGCKALESKGTHYVCKLRHNVLYRLIDGVACAPTPSDNVKCYKPRTQEVLDRALAYINR